MKFTLIILISFFFFIARAQYDNTSFFFDNNNLDTNEVFEGFENGALGYYALEKSPYKQMILTKDSISVRFGSEIIIPKKVALEKGYTFKDDKMYGVAPLNGVFYKEFNDTILALYYQYDSYFSSKGDDFIQPLENGHLLFMKENNGLFTVEYLEIKGNTMTIYSMDHTLVMDKLLKLSDIKSEQMNGVETYIANPNLKEFNKLIRSNCFDEKRGYLLNPEL